MMSQTESLKDFEMDTRMEHVVVEDMCRICGTSTSGLVRHHIFDKDESQQNLPSKIQNCLPVIILEEDVLPKFVCGECVYKVNMLHDLRDISIKTEQLLKSLISKQNSSVDKNTDTSDHAMKIDTENSENNKLNLPEDTSLDKSEQNLQDFEHFMVKKPVLKSDAKVDTQKIKVKRQKKVTINIETCEEPTRRRPIRAVRLNSDISYSSDSILENLLKKTDLHNSKKVKRGFGKPKKTILKQCKFCKVVLNSREFNSHIAEEHKKQYECNVCKNRFQNSEELDEHRTLNEHLVSDKVDNGVQGVRLLKCNLCQKTYLRKHLLVLHMRKHTGERPFPCNICERKYACKSSLNSHLLKHKEQWKHVCNFCGKGFVDKHSFIYHVRSNHTGERPFVCDKCDKKFIKKQDLLKHIQTQHTEEPKELFSCEKCGKICKDFDSLRSHRKSHIPVEERRVHKCTLCESSFTGKTGLLKHMHRHTGEMPYECGQCTKRFFTKKGLELHLIIHSGVKSFICEYCGRAFSQDNTLRVHRRTHTGERPYECDICMKRFTQSSALNSHRKLHLKDN